MDDNIAGLKKALEQQNMFLVLAYLDAVLYCIRYADTQEMKDYYLIILQRIIQQYLMPK